MPEDLTADVAHKMTHEPKKHQIWLVTGVAVAVALTTFLLCFARFSQQPVEPTATLTISPTARNARLFRLNYITNRSFDRNQPANKLRIGQSEFRVTSSAANTTPNRREVWTFNRNYANVDVTLLIGKPSSLDDSMRPQPGLALRTNINADGSGSALILDANIWGAYFDTFQINVWSWNAGLSRLKLQGDHGLPMNNRAVQIEGEWRNAGNPAVDTLITNNDFWKNNPNAFKAGDRIDVTSVTDPRYSQKMRVSSRFTSL